MNAPQLYVGQEARFGGKVVNVTKPAGENPLRNRHRTAGQRARPVLGEPSRGRILLTSMASSIRWISAVN